LSPRGVANRYGERILARGGPGGAGESRGGAARPADPTHRLVIRPETLQKILATVAAAYRANPPLLLWDEWACARLQSLAHAEGASLRACACRADQGIAEPRSPCHRQALRLDDAARDPRYTRRVLEERTSFTPRSMLCVPLVSRNALLGVIQVMNKLGGGSSTRTSPCWRRRSQITPRLLSRTRPLPAGTLYHR
jgi:GAF domain-containing protein